MESFYTPPLGASIAVASVLGLLVAIVPTCLYLFVEPRGRIHWGVAGDTPATRRAPVLVRLTAWLGFAVAQFGIGMLLVPAWCAVLFILQTKFGLLRPIGLGITVVVGAAAILQAFLALSLVPLGVRLLARDARAAGLVRARARWNGTANLAILVGGVGLVTTLPQLVHPGLRVALDWVAIRPLVAYGAVGLAHALLLGQCASVLETPKNQP